MPLKSFFLRRRSWFWGVRLGRPGGPGIPGGPGGPGGGAPGGPGGDYTQMKTRFREFLREYRTTDGSFIYREEIKRAIDTNTNFIVVNLGHMTG